MEFTNTGIFNFDTYSNSTSTVNTVLLFESDGSGYEHCCGACKERDSLHTRSREKACRSQLIKENKKLIEEGWCRVIRYVSFKWWQF